MPMDKHASSLPASKTPMSTTVAATALRKKYRRLRQQSHSLEPFSRSAFASCTQCSIDSVIGNTVCTRALSACAMSQLDKPLIILIVSYWRVVICLSVYASHV